MRGLQNKVAIVTGAGGAIGRAITLRLVEEGCRVGVFDRNGDAAAETVRRVEAAGGRADAVVVDIVDYAAVAAAVRDFEARAGTVDVLVNNAGWDRLVSFLDTEPSFWDQLIAINLRGPLNLHH